MYCTKCGNYIPEDDRFCAVCGTERKSEAQPCAASPSEPYVPSNNVTAEQGVSQQELRAGLLLCYIIQVLTLVICWAFKIVDINVPNPLHGDGTIFSSRVDNDAGMKFAAIVFIALFVFAIVRGFIHPERLQSSVLIELVIIVITGVLFHTDYRKHYDSHHHRGLMFTWVFYVALLLIASCLLINRSVRKRKQRYQ